MRNGPILLIEDDNDDIELISECLRDLKIENRIICFANGSEALTYLEATTEQPFVILCDINMPVMNGLQLREVINSTDHLRRKSIPFIFLTTSATTEAVATAYDLTVQGFFVKPSNITYLRELLKMIVDYWKTCRHPNS